MASFKDELRAAWEESRTQPVNQTPAPPAQPSADALRALRVKWGMDAQSRAVKDYWSGVAAMKGLEKSDPGNPNVADLRKDAAELLPAAGVPLTLDQAAAVRRESARTGRETEPGAPDAIRRALARGANVIDPSQGLAGKLTRLNA
ncbi:MAG: hypothetical protein ACM3UX_00620, partial [Candidatus Woesearchaeota archaeon]